LRSAAGGGRVTISKPTMRHWRRWAIHAVDGQFPSNGKCDRAGAGRETTEHAEECLQIGSAFIEALAKLQIAGD